MAITCKLSTLMGEKRYKIEQVHSLTGLSRNTISNLYHDRMERIDYNTLSRLCELFDCSVGDILEYRKDDKT